MLLTLGSTLWAILNLTSDSPEGDPFDSPYYWSAWIVIPLLAVLAAVLRPAWPRPLWWATALVLPSVVALGLQGTIFHNPDDGASFWIVGEVLLIMNGAIALGAATIVMTFRRKAR